MTKKRGSRVQDSLNVLKKDPKILVYEKTEHWVQIPYKPGFRKDLFGIVDILALHQEKGFLGIQVCAGSGDRAKHIKKIAKNHRIVSISWLSIGGALEIWSWRNLKAGWSCDVTVLKLEDLF